MDLRARYQLGALVGRGAGTAVYRAEDVEHGRRCAVKIADVTGPDRERVLRRIRREGAMLERLRMPGVVQLLGRGDGEDPWLALEWLPHNLADEVEATGPLPPRRAVQVALQILDTLDAVHHAGVVHRDIKPENVLIGEDGGCRLADFGIAEVVDEEEDGMGAAGSLPFMAPEQGAGRAGPRSDLYGVGATLYFMVTGASPVGLHASAPHSPRFAEIPRPLVDVIVRATRYDPEERPPSAAAMAENLRSVLPDLAVDPDGVGERQPSPPRAGRAVTLEESERPVDVQALEVERLRAWLDEEVEARRRAGRRMARWSLAIGITLIGVVMAVGARVSLEHWLSLQRARRVVAEKPVIGLWKGTTGSWLAELALEGKPSSLRGELLLNRGEVERRFPVRGAVDGGVLVLRVGTQGRYQAVLEREDRLDGEYWVGDTREPFHLVRVR